MLSGLQRTRVPDHRIRFTSFGITQVLAPVWALSAADAQWLHVKQIKAMACLLPAYGVQAL